jgi:hypothetical protein
MSCTFDSHQGLIFVKAELTGPKGNIFVRLALSTGATRTLVNVDILVIIGYEQALTLDPIDVTTGSGVESVSRITLSKIVALGQTRTQFPMLAHTPSTGVDGILGLDFFRGQTLTIDFGNGKINLT